MVFQCGDCKYWKCMNIWDGGDSGRCYFDESGYAYKNGSICKRFEPSVGFFSELYDLIKKAEEICGGNDYEK